MTASPPPSHPQNRIRFAAAFLGLGVLGLVGNVAMRPEAPDTPVEQATDAPTQADRSTRRTAPVMVPSGGAESDPADPTWVENELLVMAASQDVLEALAQDYGVDVAAPVGRSGFGALDVAALSGTPDRVAELRADDRMLWSGPHAIMHGTIGKGGKPDKGTDGGGAVDTGSGGDTDPWASSIRDLQWHLDDIELSPTPPDVSDITVAVLDTGVAYLDVTGQGKRGVPYVAAPSLQSSAIVAPYDFVNNDAFPHDDHFHGTHIATSIAGNGEVMGAAPGVGIMPLKVLDSQNSGHELHLVEAIHHAVDHGADIINMSLAFGSGYIPSPAMRAAIQRASDAGVVMVAAAGNDGLARISFPAASPAVVAVTSVCATAGGGHVGAPYTNASVQSDLSAPGGCLDRDTDKDGLPDGILAETIAPNNPSKIELWMFAGTSQAAALVSGAAAQALALGADPETLVLRLRANARADLGADSVERGLGTGSLDIDTINGKTSRTQEQGFYKRSYGVALLPWLEDLGTKVAPRVRVTLVDEGGRAIEKATAWVSISGDGTEVLSCITNTRGQCDVVGQAMSARAADGTDAALAWGVSVEGVQVGEHLRRPGGMLFASDALEGVLTALLDEAGIGYPMLAFDWEAGTADSELGNLADAWSVVNSGTGISTSPFGVILTRAAVDALGDPTAGELVGSGVGTEPLPYSVLTLSDLHLAYGTGISTSPFGLEPLTFVTFSGTGISTSPFGMKTVYEDPSGTDTKIFSGDPVLLQTSSFTGSSYDGAAGSSLESLLSSGGFVSLEGYPGASVLSESGSVPLTTGMAAGGGQAAGAMRLP